MKTYTSYYGTAANSNNDGDIARIINNNASDNLTWGIEQINDAIRYLVSRYYFNERSYTVPGGTVAQQQFYNMPGNIKKLINVTINIGGVLWQPQECPTRQLWDNLNVVTFYQDFPSYFFVYNGAVTNSSAGIPQVGIYPIPASNSNVMTLNYKARIIDLSMADVTQATNTTTVSVNNGSTTVTATGATFLNWMAGQWIRFPFSSTNAADGDNQWYQIASVTSSTVLVLANQYQGANITGANFTIGQVSMLPEDYQDLPLYRMGAIYYTTRFPDATRAELYQKLWDDGEARLNEEFGSKTSNVVLPDTDIPVINPNLFPRSLTGH